MLDLETYLSELDYGADVQVLEVMIHRGGGRPQVKLVVDTPAGVLVNDIVRITRQIRRDVEINTLLGTGDFHLEVTSPGMKRGLTEPWQFPRHVGNQLAVRLRPTEEHASERALINGQLLRTETTGIVVTSKSDEIEIKWEQIDQARVLLDW